MDIINDCGPEKDDVIEPGHLAYRAVTISFASHYMSHYI
jgi:hypothetical protein